MHVCLWVCWGRVGQEETKGLRFLLINSVLAIFSLFYGSFQPPLPEAQSNMETVFITFSFKEKLSVLNWNKLCSYTVCVPVCFVLSTSWLYCFLVHVVQYPCLSCTLEKLLLLLAHFIITPLNKTPPPIITERFSVRRLLFTSLREKFLCTITW